MEADVPVKRDEGFETWFRDQPEWFHEADARERLAPVWAGLIAGGLPPERVAEVFSRISGAIRGEYGE